MSRPPADFWHAAGADQVDRLPLIGEHVAFARAVWRVHHIDHLGHAGALVDLLWIGGHRPAPPEADDIDLHGIVTVLENRWWNVFPTGPWPACSCCGEPKPCSTERFNAEARAALTAWSSPASP